MAFCMLMLLLLYIWLHDRKVKKDRQAKVDEIGRRGIFDPMSEQVHVRFSYDFFRDWEGERKLVPREYVAYLERNRKALNCYANSWISEQEFNAGYRPFHSSFAYDKRNFKPYAVFENQYLWRIKELNENGLYYGG